MMFSKTSAALFSTGLALAVTTAGLAAPTKLAINLNEPVHAIPPRFYGLMTEEINYSYDGGLFAELIRNRTFQDPLPGGRAQAPVGELPPHWSVVGSASASTNQIDPVNAALPTNLRVTLNGGTGGVANDGYWGVPVLPGATYTASFYARGSAGFSGAITASLVTDAGQRTVTSAQTSAISSTWKKYTLQFTAPNDAAKTADARFVLAANGQGSIDFSFVSLFPPTYEGVANGLRPDIMKLLSAMHPGFIRLPGGNYVEGTRFSDRFAWKRMIGPAEERPGHMGCWSYRSSDGFGLPEYLLWCKQLHATPVLAVFAGYTLNGDYAVPGSPEMDLYTKEALEEIEYVTGAPETEWGKRRAADGFKEPFALEYVEIGNEDFFDHSGSYEGRFAQMAKAIRAKYPQLKIIATTPVKSFKPDLVDDHIYASSPTMFHQSTRYDVGSNNPDGRKADGVKVFMGEWATQGGSPTPNLMSALSDAAFVMGLERNSDDVRMECYAPLFANVNAEDKAKGNPRGWQWNTNLIGYNAVSAFGSPSYYVLAAFGENRGDVVLPTQFNAPQVTPPESEHPNGLIGVGTYDTRVEYKDLLVTGADGKKLSDGSLIRDSQKWKFAHGRWSTEDGVFRPVGDTPQSWALTGDPSWSDYTLTVHARKIGGPEGFLILWHSANSDNYRWWNIGGWENTVSRFEASVNGGREPYGPSTPFSVETGRWYDLKLEVSGHHARGYVDGKLVLEADDEPARPISSAFASATYINATGEVVVKVVNSVGTPLEAEIQLSGATKVGEGKAIVISGEPDAVNSLETPTKIAPKEEVISNASADFTRTFPPYSVSVLRFPAQK